MFLLLPGRASSQVDFIVKNKAGYDNQEILEVQESYSKALHALERTWKQMNLIWDVEASGKEKWDVRMSRWNENEWFLMWLGRAEEPRQIRIANKRLGKMKRVMKGKKAHLIFQSPDKTFNCKWSKHAWTIPKGKVVIHCCPQFMYLSPVHKSKAFVHEIGHESGMPFHRKVYWRRAALRTAQERPIKALKNPENYAYLVMQYYE